MPKSAAERASALGPAVEAARQRVGELQSRTAELREWAHGHYVNGDADKGDAAHEELAAVQRDLGVAEAKLATLLEAEQVVSRERQTDERRQRIAEVKAQLAVALAERDERLAEIRPAAAAAKAAIRAARAAERAAVLLDAERAGLEDAIAGRGAQIYRSNLPRVATVVDASHLLVAIECSDEV